MQSEHTVVAVWHSYVFSSLCQDLNNLPWGARTNKNSREDGDQGSLQEDTNMIAKRGEKNCSYMQKLFSILFRSKFSLVSEITLNMWQSPLLFWQKLLFLLSSLSRLFSFCWFLHLARLISCQGLLLSLLPLWSSQDLYQSYLSSQDRDQELEGGLDCQPWEKPTSKCVSTRESCHCQEGSATNHTPLPLTCNRWKSLEKEKTSPSYHVQ